MSMNTKKLKSLSQWLVTTQIPIETLTLHSTYGSDIQEDVLKAFRTSLAQSNVKNIKKPFSFGSSNRKFF